jgi:hypothetical protein
MKSRCNAVLVSPEIHRFAGELGPVVHGDRPRRSAAGDYSIERQSHLLSAERRVGMEQQALAGELVDHRQHADPAAVGQPLSDEIHAPLLVRTGGLS